MPTYDNSAKLASTGNGTMTLSLTTSGSDRYLLVGIGTSTGMTCTGITYAGVSMTQIGSPVDNTDSGAGSRLYVFELIAPASGANDIVASFSGPPSYRTMIGISVTDAHQTTPTGTSATSTTNNSATPSVTVTSATGELVVDFHSAHNTLVTFSAGSGQTSRQTNTTDIGMCCSTQDGAASVVMDWSNTNNRWYSSRGIPIKPAGGGGTAYTLTAAQGSFAESGQTAVLSYGPRLTSAVGSFALSGQNALFPVARKVTAAQGSFSLTGQTANLNAGKTITAAQGSFILTGQAAGLASARTMTAANGSFALNGQTAALLKGKTITGDVGSFALTGQSAALTSARRMTASQGSFALSGQTVALIQARLMQAANGSFTLTGQAAAMRRALRMQAAYGSFVFTGQSATLTGPSSDAVVLTHPLSFTIRSGRTYVDIASGKTEIEIESGRKTIDIG